MAVKMEDDYWFDSEQKSFDFDDDHSRFSLDTNFLDTDELLAASSTDILPAESKFADQYQRWKVPLDLIISERNLDLLTQSERHDSVAVANSPRKAIRNIMWGRPHSLNNFKSLDDKTALLDAAVQSADGNAILAVVLYLTATLDKSIYTKMIAARKLAVDHYVRYLIFRMNTNEIQDILSAHGSGNIGITLFKMVMDNTSGKDKIPVLIKKISQLNESHFKAGLPEGKDEIILKNYISLLEWQTKVNDVNVADKSLHTCLDLCCRQYWETADDHSCSPRALSRTHDCTERQLQWIFLRAKTNEQKWPDICKQLIRTNWLRQKKMFWGGLKIHNVIKYLGDNKAPINILESFLSLMDNSELSVQLGKKYKCHRYVIDKYAAWRDRRALLDYKNTLRAQSEEFFIADSVLLSGINWKN